MGPYRCPAGAFPLRGPRAAGERRASAASAMAGKRWSHRNRAPAVAGFGSHLVRNIFSGPDKRVEPGIPARRACAARIEIPVDGGPITPSAIRPAHIRLAANMRGLTRVHLEGCFSSRSPELVLINSEQVQGMFAVYHKYGNGRLEWIGAAETLWNARSTWRGFGHAMAART